jgi:putative NADH-flavin reductase
MTAIAIFGVSGRTGQALVTGARARGWSVRGFGRISSEAPVGTIMIHGGFGDVERLREVVRGADAVCCLLGPRPPYTDAFCAAATGAIIAAMTAADRRRLLCVTGAMVGDVPSRSPPMTWVAALLRWRRPAMVRDRAEQEAVVAGSALDWTLIKPPRLTDARPTGRIAAGPDVPVGLLSSISRADLAAFTLDAISDPTLVRERVIVKQGS